MTTLKLIGRSKCLFEKDLLSFGPHLDDLVTHGRFLVIGGAGSIGQAVTREIFKRDPKVLHIVDISENNLVELVRDIRSTIGYGNGDFQTFALDCGSIEFEAMLACNGPYDYIFNLSALKHVRSESDPFTLMRMIIVNVFNTINTLRLTKKMDLKKYFSIIKYCKENLVGGFARIFLKQLFLSLPQELVLLLD